MNPKLIALSGPLRGTSIELDEDEVAVGRSKAARVQIPSVAVSRQHCVIRRQAGVFTIHDLTKYGGTFLNGIQAVDHVLADGDRIAVGDSLFRFETADGPEPRSPVSPDVDESDLQARTTIRVQPQDTLYLRPDRLNAHLRPDDRLARHLAALMQISATVSTIHQPDALQKRLLDLVLGVIPADRAAILLAGREPGQFDMTSVLDRRHGPDLPVHISRTIARQVLNERTALLSNDVQEVGALSGVKSVNLSGARSVLCVPLESLGRAMGVLYLDSRTAATRFEPEHLDIAAAIAAIAAVALDTALRMEWLEDETRRLQAVISMPGAMIGESPRMREIARVIDRVAPSDATVLIRGETGTGKELVARAIHAESLRASKPFVAINCAALAESLLESELFGHEKGAFTGAVAQKKGKLEVADGGTVFLDEIGDLAASLQAKILRVLQEREFERVGGTRPLKVDIRLVAATNKNLEEAVRAGTFRQDLYYRLNVIPLVMPPLRERREDIPLLASYFAAKCGEKFHRPIQGFSPEALDWLRGHSWPGNVRELENSIERAVALGASDIISREDLADSLIESGDSLAVPSTRYHEAVREAKTQVILNAIEQAGGSFTEAADLLGVHPNYLHRLVNNLGLRAAVKR
jgi:Nif-specific regulatory protein